MTHYLVIVQGSFLKALPAEVVMAHLWPMAVAAVVTLSAATFMVRRRLQ